MNTNAVRPVLLCLGLSLYAQAGLSLELKTEQDRLNYAVGRQIGVDFRQHRVELQAPALVQGVRDALGSGEALMSEEEMEKVLVAFKNRIEAHQHAEMKRTITSTAQGDIARGRAFFAENAKKPGVTVLPSGLQYKVLHSGKSRRQASPPADGKVIINYQARLIGGRPFATSYKQGKAVPQTYALTELAPGMQEGLKRMKQGDQWELFVPSELGVPRGKGPMEMRPIIFDVELVGLN